VVHQALTDGVVFVREEGNFQLRADAISRRDEHGAPPTRKPESGPKAPDIAHHATRKGLSRGDFDEANRAVCLVNIDPGVFVADGFASWHN
jgi:hypothetical protein